MSVVEDISYQIKRCSEPLLCFDKYYRSGSNLRKRIGPIRRCVLNEQTHHIDEPIPVSMIEVRNNVVPQFSMTASEYNIQSASGKDNNGTASRSTSGIG